MMLTNFLTTEQVETIHRNALRVLAEIRVQVEHQEVRDRLASIGGQCDKASMVVRFSPQTVENYVLASHKDIPRAGSPTIRVGCGVYQSYYLDPGSNGLLPFDEEKLAKYIGRPEVCH